MTSFHQFLRKYTTEELEKKYKPQIQQLSQRSVNAILRNIEKRLAQQKFDILEIF